MNLNELDPQLRAQLSKKVARSLVRLKHSVAADVEIHGVLQEMERVGTTGAVPQIETTLNEILGVEVEV